jgi:hypothetical protein
MVYVSTLHEDKPKKKNVISKTATQLIDQFETMSNVIYL